MKCPNCGADSTTKFCPYCGSEMPRRAPIYENYTEDRSTHTTIINNYYGTGRSTNNEYNQSISQKNKLIAGFLCLFFGFFGAHYFYVGRKGMGILYLLTMGLCGFGWIIDIFRICCGKFTDSYGCKLN